MNTAFRAAMNTFTSAEALRVTHPPTPLTDAQERAILFRYLNRNGVSTTLATMADILREKAPGAASPDAARRVADDIHTVVAVVARRGL
jgi:hypothetical protein